MVSLTAWYLPGQDHPWVLRGDSGRIWAFANVPKAWKKRKQPEWRDAVVQLQVAPTGYPLGPATTQALAYFLGVPEVERPTSRTGWQIAAEYVAEVRAVEGAG